MDNYRNIMFINLDNENNDNAGIRNLRNLQRQFLAVRDGPGGAGGPQRPIINSLPRIQRDRICINSLVNLENYLQQDLTHPPTEHDNNFNYIAGFGWQRREPANRSRNLDLRERAVMATYSRLLSFIVNNSITMSQREIFYLLRLFRRYLDSNQMIFWLLSSVGVSFNFLQLSPHSLHFSCQIPRRVAGVISPHHHGRIVGPVILHCSRYNSFLRRVEGYTVDCSNFPAVIPPVSNILNFKFWFFNFSIRCLGCRRLGYHPARRQIRVCAGESGRSKHSSTGSSLQSPHFEACTY